MPPRTAHRRKRNLLTGAGKEERKVTTHRRTARERKRRQALIAEHVRQYGWVCPGFERPPHRSHDLTCDHLLAQARGAWPESDIRVLCRSCNGRRGARPQLQAPSLRLQPRPRFSRRTLIGVVPEGAGGLSKRRTPSHPALAFRENTLARSGREKVTCRRRDRARPARRSHSGAEGPSLRWLLNVDSERRTLDL
jgi:5-methylcytosine-specific restriction endonuclease McrA